VTRSGPVEGGRVELVHACDGGDPGVGDQDVDVPERSSHLRDHPLDGTFVAHVPTDGAGAPPGGANIGDHGLRR
jgi:hypothetical protein